MILILFPEHFELSLVLLGLLLAAFTFAGAMDRLQGRKALVFQEAQALSTAYGRVRLLPEVFQGPMREAIRQFTDGLLGVYGSGRSLSLFSESWCYVFMRRFGFDFLISVSLSSFPQILRIFSIRYSRSWKP